MRRRNTWWECPSSLAISTAIRELPTARRNCSPSGVHATGASASSASRATTAKKPPSILPGVFNYNTAGHAWNGPMADALLLNPKARIGLINNLVAQAEKRGYAGYVFDFENLSSSDFERLSRRGPPRASSGRPPQDFRTPEPIMCQLATLSSGHMHQGLKSPL